MNKTKKMSPISKFTITLALRHALTTRAEEKQSKDEFEWLRRTKSSDSEIAAEAFREAWEQVDKLIENDSDRRKLKKKFGIK